MFSLSSRYVALSNTWNRHNVVQNFLKWLENVDLFTHKMGAEKQMLVKNEKIKVKIV